jgi:hypothetical protein
MISYERDEPFTDLPPWFLDEAICCATLRNDRNDLDQTRGRDFGKLSTECEYVPIKDQDTFRLHDSLTETQLSLLLQEALTRCKSST